MLRNLLGQKQQTGKRPPPALCSDPVGEFLVLNFATLNIRKSVDGRISIDLVARHDEEDLAITLVWGGEWSGHVGAVRLDRVDERSDRFVTALANLMQASAHRLMKDNTVFVAHSLHGDPRKALKKRVVVKLTCDPEFTGHEQHAEMFLEADLPKGCIMFSEKDADYRKGLLEALARPE